MGKKEFVDAQMTREQYLDFAIERTLAMVGLVTEEMVGQRDNYLPLYDLERVLLRNLDFLRQLKAGGLDGVGEQVQGGKKW